MKPGLSAALVTGHVLIRARVMNGFNQGSSFSCNGDAGGLDRTFALSLIEHLNAKLHVSTIRLAPRHRGRRKGWAF